MLDLCLHTPLDADLCWDITRGRVAKAMPVPSSREVVFISEAVLADSVSEKIPWSLTSGPLPMKGIFKSGMVTHIFRGSWPRSSRIAPGQALCGQVDLLAGGTRYGVSAWTCPEVQLRGGGTLFQMPHSWILGGLYFLSGGTMTCGKAPILREKARKLV